MRIFCLFIFLGYCFSSCGQFYSSTQLIHNWRVKSIDEDIYPDDLVLIYSFTHDKLTVGSKAVHNTFNYKLESNNKILCSIGDYYFTWEILSLSATKLVLKRDDNSIVSLNITNEPLPKIVKVHDQNISVYPPLPPPPPPPPPLRNTNQNNIKKITETDEKQ